MCACARGIFILRADSTVSTALIRRIKTAQDPVAERASANRAELGASCRTVTFAGTPA
jgi:hypothetical protein